MGKMIKFELANTHPVNINEDDAKVILILRGGELFSFFKDYISAKGRQYASPVNSETTEYVDSVREYERCLASLDKKLELLHSRALMAQSCADRNPIREYEEARREVDIMKEADAELNLLMNLGDYSQDESSLDLYCYIC